LAAAFSPACLPLSMEVRNYSLLLLLSALALLQFERAVEDRSTLGMAAFSVVLYLAILAHYSALFLTASLFVYAPIRFWSRRSRPSSVASRCSARSSLSVRHRRRPPRSISLRRDPALHLSSALRGNRDRDRRLDDRGRAPGAGAHLGPCAGLPLLAAGRLVGA